MEEFITFEQRWRNLLKDSTKKLSTLTNAGGSDMQIRELWCDINRLVSIMAIPQDVRSPMRKTLWQMACRSSRKQAGTIFLYLLFTFLPRHAYRNTDTQRWFKKRFGIQ